MNRGIHRLRAELLDYLRDGGSPVEVLEMLSQAMESFIRPSRGWLDEKQGWRGNYESAIQKVEKWAIDLRHLLQAHSKKTR